MVQVLGAFVLMAEAIILFVSLEGIPEGVQQILREFRAHHSRLFKWIATWGWAGLLIAGLTFVGVDEYLVALLLLVMSGVSLCFSATTQWQIEGTPAVTMIVKSGGVVVVK